MTLVKNRNRDPYSFANINLLGRCNAKCFFCLGGDITEQLAAHNQMGVHFSSWKNFERFLEMCQHNNVRKLYMTGQTADGLQYRHLSELVDYLQKRDFIVGVRTNGKLAPAKMDTIKAMKGGIGYSIHSLRPETNRLIGAPTDVPWDDVINASGPNVRVSIVVNRHNVGEFAEVVKYISKFRNVRYIQARRVCTDTRLDLLQPDIDAYNTLHSTIKACNEKHSEFCLSPSYLLCGKPVFFWETIGTSVNSLNYFTDGTCSDEYFVVEGYLKGNQ